LTGHGLRSVRRARLVDQPMQSGLTHDAENSWCAPGPRFRRASI
jgi:hypothetical protein